MDTDQLIWTVSIALAIIAVLQVLYFTALGFTLRRPRIRRQPTSPIMPTTPHGGPQYSTQRGVPGSTGTEEGSIGKMVILRGISNLSEVPLPSNDFGIGRFYNPDGNVLVALDERSISRRHATFISDIPTREYYLTDTHSSYGTRIQIGNQFETLTPGKAQRIYNEDVIQFGHVVTVRFTLPCPIRPTGTRMY